MRTRIVGLAGLVVALGVIAPASASAADITGYGFESDAFTVKGTGGTKVSVYMGVPPLGADIVVRKKKLSTVYSGQATAIGDTFKADFGNLGKIDLTFKSDGSSPAPVPLPAGCSGSPDSARTGKWKGTFDFKGEKGFTKASLSSVEGRQVTRGTRTCSNPPPTTPFYQLTASASFSGGSSRFFQALRGADGDVRTSSYFALAMDLANDVVARRRYAKGAANDTAGSKLFAVNAALTNAKVKLINSATYTPSDPNGGGNGSFLGKLEVRFLGDKKSRDVPFAGPAFDAFLDLEE